MDDLSQGDICRVCRCEAQQDRPLFYPCICTGSIKYIHQDCLMQWMRYSHKEYCELCGHRFSFQPIYAADMPRVLPLRDVLVGLMSACLEAARCWLHFSLVGIAWIGIVPLSAYRTYRYLFRASSFEMILSLPFDIFSLENLASDTFRGCFVVACTLLSFIGLVWVREQILHGGGPDWLERDDGPAVAAPPAHPHVAPPADNEPEAAGVNDDNNNDEAPLDVPMNNEEPAVADPADEEGDPPLEPLLAPAVGDAPGAAADGAIPAGAEADNDEQNWNPMEWERAEELTWERLLGFDGSLLFLEHVFWIISLNTMFIFTFAFCPYCVGSFVLSSMNLLQPEKPLLHFHGLITTLFGYCCIGLTLVALHFNARILEFRRISWFIGICYIVVKVSLLSVVEIGVLPLICGWWLDICSLPLLDASLKDRKASFEAAPGTSLFVHWMFGMVYVYYFAAFVSLLREVLRPGVLWFFRNVNDPDFSPIQEMIHVPIAKHIRRLIASAMIFGFAILLMLWIPVRILQVIWPSFLPYALSGDSEVNDLSLQLLLLQIVLPGFFEQTQTRIWLKHMLRIWCVSVGWMLGLSEYLLPAPENEANANAPVNAPDNADDNGNQVQEREEEAEVDGRAPAAAPPPQVVAPPPPPPEVALPRNLAAAHQAIMQRDVPVGFQPYKRPTIFVVRLFGLLLLMCLSIVFAAIMTLTVPVYIGRRLMMLWTSHAGPGAPDANQVAQQMPLAAVRDGGAVIAARAATRAPNLDVATTKNPRMLRAHELYTAELGGYMCWIVSRTIAVVVTLLPQGRAAIMNRIRHWARVCLQYAVPVVTFLVLSILVPLLFGLLLELVVIIPLRVPLWMTPIHFMWQDWALGVLYTKIAIAITLMGPDWTLKRALERAYNDGLRDFDVRFVLSELALPVITAFGLALAIPYVIGHSVLPLFFANPSVRQSIVRLVYPVCFVIVGSILFVMFQIKQLKKLYLSIKVDKYLVGQRLVNYEHRKKQQKEKEQQKQRKEAAAKATEQAAAANEAAAAAAQPDDPAAGAYAVIPVGDLLLDNAEQAVLHARRRRAEIARPLLLDAQDELL